MNFFILKNAVAKKFNSISKDDLFLTDVEKDDLYQMYLNSFPGGDKTFRTRSEHDCSACKSFIRQVGNIVSINNKNELETLWDIEDISLIEPSYDIVAKKMSEFVKSKQILNCFLTDLKTIGVDKSLERIFKIDEKTGFNIEDKSGTPIIWNHFYINIPTKFIERNDKIGTKLSEMRSTHDVLLRCLIEVPKESIDIVLELIAEGALYRGEEFKHCFVGLKNIKKEFDIIPENLKDNFVWSQLSTIPGYISHIYSNVTGTLLKDITDGLDIDTARHRFGSKMEGYQRTNQAPTKKQTEDGKKKLTELGLMSALERRYATLEDLNINNLLFVDRSVKSKVFIDVFDKVIDSIPDSKKKSSKTETVTIEHFISDILPNINKVEILVENYHSRNFMSLITAVDPTAKQLFKWNNLFSHTYVGDNADSIRERVKLAGGSIEGEFNNRVGWFNTDDLDAHMLEPGGNEIYFSNKRSFGTGGQLDVDMNAGSNLVRNPVENITYKTIKQMRPGIYSYFIHQFNCRENIDYGFDAEIEILGNILNFTYRKPVKKNDNVHVADFKKIFGVDDKLELVKTYIDSSKSTRTIWNIATEKYHPVNAIMLSPNFWDGNAIGNKHYFFIVNNCINDGSARGFYNEFLHPDLSQHRQIMDIVGSKMRTSENDIRQLSGLGFSSTIKNKIKVRVSGSFTRELEILINK